jgi:aprataxin
MAAGARSAGGAVHWPTGKGGWASALTLFAKCESPKTSLPDGVYLRSNEQTLAIYDGYAKAKFHFLVLPRIPFVLGESTESPTITCGATSEPKLALAGGQLAFGRSAKGTTVPESHLRSLRALLASPYSVQVLSALKEQSQQVVGLIKEEMRHTPLPGQSEKKVCDVEWGIRVGFHSVPSMETVHVHVISDDLVSDRLKNKKHYQSFHPTQGFWLDLDHVLQLARSGKTSVSWLYFMP